MAVDKWEPGCRCSAKLRRVRAEGRMMRGLADDGDGTDTPDNSRSLTGLLVSHDGDCPPSEASAQRVIWRWVNAATTPEHSPRHELGGHAEAGRVPILTGSGGHRSQMDLGGPAARPDSPSSVEVARARAAVAGGGPSRQAELGGHGTDERNMSPDVAGAYPPGSMGGGMGTSPDLRSEEGVWTRPVSTPDLPSDEEADGRDGAHGKGDGDVELSLHGAGQRGVEQGDPGGRQHCAVESPQRTRDALQEDPRGYRGGAEGQDSGAVGRSTGGSWHGEGVDSAGERGLGHASGDGEAGAAKSERIQSQAQDQYEVKEDPQASGAAERLVSVDDVLLLESDESVCNLGEVASAEACIDAQSYKGTAGSRRVEDTPCGGSEHPSAARMHSGGADAPPPRVSSPTNSLSSPHKPFIESGRSGHTQNPTDNDFASPCVDIKAHKPRPNELELAGDDTDASQNVTAEGRSANKGLHPTPCDASPEATSELLQAPGGVHPTMLDEPTTPASSANGEKSPALEGLDEPASGSGDGPGDRRVQDPAADATQEQAGVEGGHEEENGEGRGMLGAEMTSRTWERVAVLPPRGLMAPPRKMSMPGMHRTSLVMPVTQLGVCSGTDYSTGGEDTDAGAHSLLSLEGGVQLCCFDSTGLPLCSLAHGTSLLPRARLGLIGAVYTSGTTSGIQLCSLDTEGACVRYMGMYRGRLIAVFILKSSSKCRGEMVHRLYQMFEGALNMLVGDAAMSVHLENIKVMRRILQSASPLFKGLLASGGSIAACTDAVSVMRIHPLLQGGLCEAAFKFTASVGVSTAAVVKQGRVLCASEETWAIPSACFNLILLLAASLAAEGGHIDVFLPSREADGETVQAVLHVVGLASDAFVAFVVYPGEDAPSRQSKESSAASLASALDTLCASGLASHPRVPPGRLNVRRIVAVYRGKGDAVWDMCGQQGGEEGEAAVMRDGIDQISRLRKGKGQRAVRVHMCGYTVEAAWARQREGALRAGAQEIYVLYKGLGGCICASGGGRVPFICPFAGAGTEWRTVSPQFRGWAPVSFST